METNRKETEPRINNKGVLFKGIITDSPVMEITF